MEWLTDKDFNSACVYTAGELLNGAHGEKDLDSTASVLAKFPGSESLKWAHALPPYCEGCQATHSDKAVEGLAHYLAKEGAIAMAFFYAESALIALIGDEEPVPENRDEVPEDQFSHVGLVTGTTPDQRQSAIVIPLIIKDGIIDELAEVHRYPVGSEFPDNTTFNKHNSFWRTYTKAIENPSEGAQILDNVMALKF